MTPQPPRKDHLGASAPDLRPEPHRMDISPRQRKWFPRNRAVVRWTRDLGTPVVKDWSQAFTVLHQVQDINWNDGGSSFTKTGKLHPAEPQPSWGPPEETAEGWELPFGLRLFPASLNRIDLALTDVAWHDQALAPPPLMRRHLRPDYFEEAMSSDKQPRPTRSRHSL